MSNTITVSVIINSKVSKVWECFTNPKHIMGWNNASKDWECPKATNDLRVGGRFCYNMAAKDKTMSFDYSGVYHNVETNKLINFTLCEVGSSPMDSDRRVKVEFKEEGENTIVTETFDPENENSEELQKRGWQAILNNFKVYTENQSDEEFFAVFH
jgi:uncharacterized protein YndB with AHSA1/START domain